MIPVTVMVTGKGTVSTRIKGHYGPRRPSSFSDILRPIVFWNITYKCNLKCIHCYISAGQYDDRYELSTEEAVRVSEEIVKIGVPLVILSGGEPLVRSDFWQIVEPMANKKRPKLSLSTNGTLITKDIAQQLASYGFVYVGISIDSIVPARHDYFRGVKGAFEAAMRGIKNSLDAGIDVGIRTTITRFNVDEVPDILRWAYDNGIRRVSLYILDTVGRGAFIKDLVPSHDQLKKLAHILVNEARKYADNMEILVVRAQFLGIYLASILAKNKEEFIQYIRMLDAQGNCGKKSISIYPDGEVKPCQFIDWVSLGNVREKPLSEILRNDNKNLEPFIHIENYLRGQRCGKCPFRRICGGGSRGRAAALTGDEWGDDPLCFLDYIEIAKKYGLDVNTVL